MTTAVCLQVRLGSSRLPEKALLPIKGKAMIAHSLSALAQVEADYHLVLTDQGSAPTLKPLAQDYGFAVWPGPEQDVLYRFHSALHYYGVDYGVRATGDNPLVLAAEARASLQGAIDGAFDYFTYTNMPLGTGVEVISASALARAHGSTSSSFDREHVCPFLYNNPDQFSVARVPHPLGFNWDNQPSFTVDTMEDFNFVSQIMTFLPPQPQITFESLVKLDAHIKRDDYFSLSAGTA